MRHLRHTTLLLPFLALACSSSHPAGPTTRPDPNTAAYAAGRAEAEGEVANQRVRWLRLAEGPEWDRQSGLDAETGLPWVAANHDDPSSRGRVEGHNAVVTEYIRQYGLPEGSRKAYEPQLLNLGQYFASQARDGRVTELPLEGRAVFAPDKSFALAWRRMNAPGRPTALVLVRGERTGAILPPLPATQTIGEIQFTPGPQGADVAVFHWTSPNADAREREGYSALDLRSGLWLRHELVRGTE